MQAAHISPPVRYIYGPGGWIGFSSHIFFLSAAASHSHLPCSDEQSKWLLEVLATAVAWEGHCQASGASTSKIREAPAAPRLRWIPGAPGQPTLGRPIPHRAERVGTIPWASPAPLARHASPGDGRRGTLGRPTRRAKPSDWRRLQMSSSWRAYYLYRPTKK